MAALEEDLNSMIAKGVNARIEAAVAEAILKDEVMAKFVVAALQQPISTGNYNRDKTTFINHIIGETIKERTKEVVAEEVVAAEEAIRSEVRKALKKSVGVLADALVDGFVQQAKGAYPSIEVTFAGQD